MSVRCHPCAVVLVLAAFSCFVSCGGPSKQGAAGGPEKAGTASSSAPAAALPRAAVAETPAAKAAELPTDQGKGAEVSYVEGSAETKAAEGDWKALDIGDLVPNGNSVRTGKGAACILKFGALGAVRIGADSLVNVSSLRSGARTGSVAVDLNSGLVVCKVRKLVSKDSFEVKTNVAVLGVRGTEFMVEVLPDGKTINVAVADGAVSVLPHTFNTIALMARSLEEPARTGGALEIAETLSSLSPVVAAGQEARVEMKDMAKINEAYARLLAQAETAAAPAPPEELPAGKEEGGTAPEATPSAPAPTAAAPSAIELSNLTRKIISQLDAVSLKQKTLSASSKTLLLGARDLQLDAPSAEPKEAEPAPQSMMDDAAKREETVAQLPQEKLPEPIVFRSFNVETDPPTASIYLQDKYASSGSYEAKLDSSKSYTLTVSKSGYESVSRVVEPGLGDESVKVALEPLRLSFTLKSDPSNSSVFSGGRLIGTTPCLVTGIYGQELALRLRKPGYEELSTSVRMDSPMPKEVGVNLEPIPVKVSFIVQPEGAKLSVDGVPSGVGSCSFARLAGTEVLLRASAPGYAPEERRFVVGNVDAEVPVRLLSLREVSRAKVSQSEIRALVWYGGRLIYSDSAGSIGALQFDESYKASKAWTVQTANTSMSQYSLLVRDNVLAFAGSAEWISLEADSGKVIAREPLKGEYASLSGRPGLGLASVEIRPRTNGISLRHGDRIKELSFPQGSLMYPVAYGNQALIADSLGTLYFIDPQNDAIADRLATKAGQPFETGVFVDGKRGYFAGRLGDVASVDLDARSIRWQRKIETSGNSSFVYDIQDAGQWIGLYSRGRFYLLDKDSGEQLPFVAGNLSARPCLDGKRLFAPTSSGEIVEYSLPEGKLSRSLGIGASITSIISIPTQPFRIAIGLKDGTLLLYNPEGEK